MIESISSLVTAFAIIFVVHDFRNQRHSEANVLTATSMRGGEPHGVLLHNSGDSPVCQVQIKICGQWDSSFRSTGSGIVLPCDRGRFRCWANILSGDWYVEAGNPDGKGSYNYSELYSDRFDETKHRVTPVYSDRTRSMFYVAELVYTDSKGNRWLRKAIEENRLCLGRAKRVAEDYFLQ